MTTTLTNFRTVGAPRADRTVYRSNTEPVPPDAYPVPLDVVLDLRRADEIAALPHPLADRAGYRHVPLFDPAAGAEAAPGAVQLEEQYVDWLERHATTIAAVFRALAAARGDVLVCCSAGKDRTGLVSALLTRLWGAELDVIGADYAATGPLLRERFAAELAASDDPERTRTMQRCVPETMTTVIEHVERRFGGVAAYLRHIGVGAEDVAAL